MFIWIVSPICSVFIMKPPLETGYGVYVRACVWARVLFVLCILWLVVGMRDYVVTWYS